MTNIYKRRSKKKARRAGMKIRAPKCLTNCKLYIIIIKTKHPTEVRRETSAYQPLCQTLR